MTLWCLATCSEYRTIAHLFGVARCTVCVILHDTCKAIISVLQKQFIKFPCGEDLKTAAEEFKSKTGTIQCVGSIDGCHISITPPALNHTDYYNRKGWYQLFFRQLLILTTCSVMCVWAGQAVCMMHGFLLIQEYFQS